MALIPAEELASLVETAHLLGLPKNTKRLLSALHRATRGKCASIRGLVAAEQGKLIH